MARLNETMSAAAAKKAASAMGIPLDILIEVAKGRVVQFLERMTKARRARDVAEVFGSWTTIYSAHRTTERKYTST